MTQRGLADHS